jgi:hypothetical protein
MKNLKSVMAVAVGGVILLGATSVSAQVVPPNVPGQWDTLQPGPGQYSFEGRTLLTAPIGQAECLLELTGSVDQDLANDIVTIEVTGYNITPIDALCGSITLHGFPWHAYANSSATTPGIPGSQSPGDTNALNPVSGEFRGIDVRIFGFPTCSGEVAASFQNGPAGGSVSDPSFFTFNSPIGSSGCSVTTLDPTGLDSGTSDVNAW